MVSVSEDKENGKYLLTLKDGEVCLCLHFTRKL